MARSRSSKRKKLTGPIHGRIAKLRGDRDLNQQALADLVVEHDDDLDQLHFTTVSHWETGASLPPPELLPAIAKALKVSVDELIDGETAYDKLREAFAS